jgi:type IV secretory pathway TrbF-like protein
MFFKKKETTPLSPSSVTKPERKYFEVFGDTLAATRVYQAIIFSLVMGILMLILLLERQLRRPPLVIRVDSLGRADSVNKMDSTQRASPPEITNFTHYFLHHFTAWDVNIFDEEFERSFGMMTQACRQKMNNYLTMNRIPETIKRDKMKVDLNITEIIISKDTPDFVTLKVKGYREIKSYESVDVHREVIFEDTIVLKRVPRTEKTPWGLLVEDWAESLFKDK